VKHFRSMRCRQLLFCVVALLGTVSSLAAASLGSSAEQTLARYFESETTALESRCLSTNAVKNWHLDQENYRRELQEMLGLTPMPERHDLRATVTGQIEHDDFIVEKVHFQASPGLYVTANLYRPKRQQGPLPTILYLSGHGPVIKGGISYGNKVSYQHHGAWFARNGYVCLVTDTLQLGEIQGLHHGTYSNAMWWWNSRGYTPAGVEAWNGIRALDYLSTRPEVDTNRFGVTGRSGGGAYSWWVAALDERVKVAAPVAGITDLRNYVVDGAVEGHCDCMFFVNTYRWDYPQVAALVAPRPLMIANSDRDSIFPLDGVERLHRKVRDVYDAAVASTNLALLITDGPHKDTQDLQLHVFRWFNRRLKNEDPLIEMAAVKFFQPEQLKVFDTLPSDAVNKTVQEIFVPMAGASRGMNPETWQQQNSNWLAQLRSKVFAGWPQQNGPLQLLTRFSAERDGLLLRALDFVSQSHVPLRLYEIGSIYPAQPRRITLNVLGPGTSALGSSAAGPDTILQWKDLVAFLSSEFPAEAVEELSAGGLLATNSKPIEITDLRRWIRTNHVSVAFVAPRGIGLGAWNSDERAQTQIRRRFMLLGQTVDSMRVWDIRRAVQALRLMHPTNAPISIQAEGPMAVNVLYASLFEPVSQLQLWNLPASQREGPDYLNVLQVADIPQVTCMALNLKDRAIHLHGANKGDWEPILEFARKQPPGTRSDDRNNRATRFTISD